MAQVHVYYVSIIDSHTTYLTSSLILLLLARLSCCNQFRKVANSNRGISPCNLSPRTMQYPYPHKSQPTYLLKHHVLCAIHPLHHSLLPHHPYPPPPSSPSPPFLPTPKPHQPLPPNPIPILQQIRDIEIQRTIHLRVREQLMDSLERGNEGVGG